MAINLNVSPNQFADAFNFRVYDPEVGILEVLDWRVSGPSPTSFAPSSIILKVKVPQKEEEDQWVW